MKHLILLTLILMAGLAHGQTSAMVEKHIFTPSETASSETPPPNKTDNLLKNGAVQLTGIIVTPREKKAVFSLKEKGDSPKGRRTYREGDPVMDQMTVESIHPNYVLVNQNGTHVRINLFGGGKNRPEPPVIAAGPSENPQKADKGETLGAPPELQAGEQAPNPLAPKASPFGGGKKGVPPRQTIPGGKDIPDNISGDGASSGAAVGKFESHGSDETNSPAEVFKKLTEQNMQRHPGGTPGGASRNQLLEILGGSKPN